MSEFTVRAREIFQAAIEIEDLEARNDFVHRECGANSELLREIEKLLAAHEQSGAFIDQPVLRPREVEPATVEPSMAGPPPVSR